MLVVLGTVESGAAATITGLLVLAALIWVIPAADLKQLFENLKSLKVGPDGVSAEFYRRVTALAGIQAPEQQEKETPPSVSAGELRLLMEAKLAYIAKDLLDAQPTFVTVGSLNYDGFLDDETAAVADDIMTLRDEDLRDISQAERDNVLRAADDVVRTIRARVLHGWVKKILDEADGWTMETVDRGPDKLPDFLAVRGGTRVLVASVFATSENSAILGRAKKRIEQGADAPPDVSQRVIVVPRRAYDSVVQPEADPAVVRAQDLNDLLGRIQTTASADKN